MNELDTNRGTIVVKGGTFKNFNPACNWSEGANTNFVHSDYKVEGKNLTTGLPVAASTLTSAYDCTWNDSVEYKVVAK